MKITLPIGFIVLALMAQACQSEDPADMAPQTQQPVEWLVPADQVFDGGPGKDGIPSIDNPQFTTASTVDFLNDDDLVLGIAVGKTIKAYPHSILDWHEIVNDRLEDVPLAVTYCPLTGTGVGWSRLIGGQETTFGVSGLLYNTNLMPYDRASNSTWSQQRLDCVNGTLIGSLADTRNLIEMPWSAWKEAYPNSLVLNTQTGYSRTYGNYPYGDYRTNHSRLIFPVSFLDDRLLEKERTLGIITSKERIVYAFDNGSTELDLVMDNLNERKIAVVRSRKKNVMVAFFIPEGRTMELVDDRFPIVLEDDLGNQYDVLGRSAAGAVPRLEQPAQFIGYWFSWGTFYQGIDLYDE